MNDSPDLRRTTNRKDGRQKAENLAETAWLLLRLMLTFIAALIVAFLANWLLIYFGINPFGIRDFEW